MLHPETHLVTKDNGPRPAGKPGECFYCNQPLGSEHRKDCVSRRRTIVVRYSIEVTICVPEIWDEATINFHRNDSPWCADNVITELQRSPENRRLCDVTKAEFVREATREDEERFGIPEQLEP